MGVIIPQPHFSYHQQNTFLISHIISPPLFSGLDIFSSSPPTMATLQSLALYSPVSYASTKTRSVSGLAAWSVQGSAMSAFSGQSLSLRGSIWGTRRQSCGSYKLRIMMVKTKIQFIKGTDELTIPDVRLTKSRDGTNGMAIFTFDQPSVFDSSGGREVGDITGFYMIDEEGVLQSVDVSAKFVNGKPSVVEAKYIMRTPRDWDRFMRFMERYSNDNGLQFVKS